MGGEAVEGVAKEKEVVGMRLATKPRMRDKLASGGKMDGEA